jgi:hypothetical protein
VGLKDTDRYARAAGVVYIGDRCLNEELIEAGHAWVYRMPGSQWGVFGFIRTRYPHRSLGEDNEGQVVTGRHLQTHTLFLGGQVDLIA